MFSLFHSFCCQYANTLLLFTLINFLNLFSISLPCFSLKINKDAYFYPEATTDKIVATLQFFCPCVLIFTFLDPILCAAVHGGMFKYKGVSSMFAIAFNSKSYLFLNLMLYYFLHSIQAIISKFLRNMGASSKS